MHWTKLSLCPIYLKSSPIGLNKLHCGLSEKKLHGLKTFTQSGPLLLSFAENNFEVNHNVFGRKK